MAKLKSVPLNQEMRARIIKNILKASPEQKALDKHDEKGPALALKLSDNILGPRNKKAYRSLPIEMLNGNRTVDIKYGKRTCQVKLPEGFCHHSKVMQVEGAPATLKRSILSWMEKREKFARSLYEANSKVWTLMDGLSNTSQLLEEIPDAFQFFPDELKHKAQGSTLPAVPAQAVQDVQKIVAASAKNLQKEAA